MIFIDNGGNSREVSSQPALRPTWRTAAATLTQGNSHSGGARSSQHLSHPLLDSQALVPALISAPPRDRLLSARSPIRPP
eukprot:6699002-Pyramimonas_sp.AAC.1